MRYPASGPPHCRIGYFSAAARFNTEWIDVEIHDGR